VGWLATDVIISFKSVSLQAEGQTVDENRDRVLVVDSDPNEGSLLVETALEPFGYEARWLEDGGAALSAIMADPPDVLLLDLNLIGLSGQDVIAALNAQAFDLPVIVMTDRGFEGEALQAFRLGAKDYVVRPLREAEVIQAIERALKEVRLRREREALVSEVQHAALEAQQRLSELKTLMGIGKSVAALGRPEQVFDRVVRAAMYLTRAESAGLFLSDDASGSLVLRAGQNLPRDLLNRVGQPVEDRLAALVMRSQETYIATIDDFQQFQPAHEGARAIIYAPLVIHEQPIGLLWVANTRLAFEYYMRDLMTALADYAAISVVNVRLFSAVHERSKQLEAAYRQLQARQQWERESGVAEQRQEAAELAQQLRQPLTELLGNMNLFRTGEMGQLGMQQQAAADVMTRQLAQLINLIDSLVPPDTGGL
jgi:two-component system NtrC family sensor kinase